jgi:hypothetical protein
MTILEIAMTTIGSTAYYTSTTRYGGSEKAISSNVDDAYAISSQPQENQNETGGPQSSSSDAESIFDARPSSVTVNFQGKLFTLEGNFHKGSETLKGTPIWELPYAEYQEYLAKMEDSVAGLEEQYTDHPWTATIEESLKAIPVSPATQPYATVIVNGKVVTTIDNQGIVGTTDDVLGQRLQSLLLGDVNGTNGPDLAQARAEQIAALLGGRVSKSGTAMTQREFSALPPIEDPNGTIDYEALRQDPLYTQLQSLKEKRAAYLNQ